MDEDGERNLMDDLALKRAGYVIHTWLQPGDWNRDGLGTRLNGFLEDCAIRDVWLKPGVNEMTRGLAISEVMRQSLIH
jgi:hypothetical protein